MTLLYKITAFVGITALIPTIYAIGFYTHPAISISIVLWCSLAAYFLGILVILAGKTIIEKLLAVFLITALALTSLFASGDQLSDDFQLLLWSLLLAAWYTPVLLFCLVVLFDANEEAGEPALNEQSVDTQEVERQQLIEKSLRRRKRKQKNPG